MTAMHDRTFAHFIHLYSPIGDELTQQNKITYT
jgi:hypothetical protein